jgi:SAM-dependent methyltransferase
MDTKRPKTSYSGPLALRDSRQLMTEIANRLPNRGAVLDLGCGPRDQAVCFGHLGFNYVGIDYLGDAADLLADAHSLPFADSTFDCVFSYAVLEHLHNPFLAIGEVSRVLKPGGFYVGTVSQGEPFHSSYFHPTGWGMLSLVSSVSELRLVKMWDGIETLTSLATMGRYPRVIRFLLAGLSSLHDRFTWLAPRRMRWSVKNKELDALYRAGAICFVVQKRGVHEVGDPVWVK